MAQPRARLVDNGRGGTWELFPHVLVAKRQSSHGTYEVWFELDKSDGARPGRVAYPIFLDEAGAGARRLVGRGRSLWEAVVRAEKMAAGFTGAGKRAKKAPSKAAAPASVFVVPPRGISPWSGMPSPKAEG